MTINSRQKGHSFEREVASELRKIFPEARRGLQYQDGPTPPDVTGTPFHVECKRGRRPNPRAALKQAINDAAPGVVPVAVIRDDRAEAFICMRWSDWMDFVREWRERAL
ncbi:MAG: hypothetical protein GY854_19740 [Deltaproteobacteria bacterium]|nr:hypothetical protein [Deltaproteobacteria bacterium]